MENEEVKKLPCNIEELKKAFWETQNQLLQSTLYRSNSIEMKIRNDTKKVLKKLKGSVGSQCTCQRQRPLSWVCQNCLRSEVCQSLKNNGHDSTICKSKWTFYDNLSVDHDYIQVVYNSSKKKAETKVLIELNFRAEFEMVKGSKEYNHLIGMVPEVYVGKSERLREVVKILCMASKVCMKEKKIHLGLWRTERYMQAKWIGNCSVTASTLLFGGTRKLKSKTSMLTADLLGTLHTLHPIAIKV